MEAARKAGCHEAVLIDSAGLVTEATHSSLIWVRNGRLEGTPEGQEILPGTTRQHVLRLAAAINAQFNATRVTLPEFLAAEEVILFGTTIEVLPVVRVDSQPIGTGRPGPIGAGSARLLAPRSRAGWQVSTVLADRCGRQIFVGSLHDHERCRP